MRIAAWVVPPLVSALTLRTPLASEAVTDRRVRSSNGSNLSRVRDGGRSVISRTRSRRLQRRFQNDTAMGTPCPEEGSRVVRHRWQTIGDRTTVCRNVFPPRLFTRVECSRRYRRGTALGVLVGLLRFASARRRGDTRLIARFAGNTCAAGRTTLPG